MKPFQYTILLLMILLSCQCGLRNENPERLFQEYLSKEAFHYIRDFEGDGATVFPEFMSWGIFNYNCNSDYIKFLRQFNHFPVKSEFNNRFKLLKPSYFPNNTEFYTKDSKKNLKTDFNRDKCIYISGIVFPYGHNILIDTTTYEVVHLVSGVRE